MSHAAYVYLCGPITGLSYQAARYGWRKTIADMLDPSIGVLSPMRQEGHLSEVQAINHNPTNDRTLHTQRGIVRKDKLDVRRSTIVVANFLDAKVVSQGSLIELGWADMADKDIMLIMEKDGSNVHDRFFARDLASYRVDSVEEAAHTINALLLPGV
jgi:hypothetical protein